MLKNKAGLWKSVDKWVFKTGDNDLIYIENNSKTSVLEATSDGNVIEEVLLEGKAEQLWEKGTPNAEGYFTLKSHSETPKVITAISESGLKIKGNLRYSSQLCLFVCLLGEGAWYMYQSQGINSLVTPLLGSI